MKRVEEIVDAELKAESGVTQKKPKLVYKYNDIALESARVMFRSGSPFITNPYDISDRSLLTMDSDWIADLGRYIAQIEYRKNEKKPKKKPGK